MKFVVEKGGKPTQEVGHTHMVYGRNYIHIVELAGPASLNYGYRLAHEMGHTLGIKGDDPEGHGYNGPLNFTAYGSYWTKQTWLRTNIVKQGALPRLMFVTASQCKTLRDNAQKLK